MRPRYQRDGGEEIAGGRPIKRGGLRGALRAALEAQKPAHGVSIEHVISQTDAVIIVIGTPSTGISTPSSIRCGRCSIQLPINS